jgi:hypothetical protein
VESQLLSDRKLYAPDPTYSFASQIVEILSDLPNDLDWSDIDDGSKL